MIYLLQFFSYQNILHVVSNRKKRVDGYDVVSDSWLYGRVFSTSQPYAVTVYDAEKNRTYDGMTSLYPHFLKKLLVIYCCYPCPSVRPPEEFLVT